MGGTLFPIMLLFLSVRTVHTLLFLVGTIIHLNGQNDGLAPPRIGEALYLITINVCAREDGRYFVAHHAFCTLCLRSARTTIPCGNTSL